MQTFYTYDLLGRLTEEREEQNNRVNSTLNYEYDRFGNRTELRAVYPAGSFEKSYTTTYVYGLSNRLLKEIRSEGETVETYTYTYDSNGSQTRRELERTYPDGKGPRGRIGFVTGYNRPGQTTLDFRQYNAFGQLVRVSRDCQVINYTYRPDGLMHSKTVRSSDENHAVRTVHYWDGQNIVLEVNGHTNAVKARYLRGANLVAQEIGSDLLYYLHNAHGDVVQRLGDGANHAPVYKYDSFGNERKPVDTDPNPFRYCGEYWDNDLGELYLRARTYDPRTGRFSTEDPARDGGNWYSYCGGEPVNSVDPSGLRSIARVTNPPKKNVISHAKGNNQAPSGNTNVLIRASGTNNPTPGGGGGSSTAMSAAKAARVVQAPVYAGSSPVFGNTAPATIEELWNLVVSLAMADGPALIGEIIALFVAAGVFLGWGVDALIGFLFSGGSSGLETPEEEAAAESAEGARLDGIPRENHTVRQQGVDVGKTGNLSREGDPNSSEDLLNQEGELIRRRYYGPDGQAQEDIDYSHGGVGHTFPHRHQWNPETGRSTELPY